MSIDSKKGIVTTANTAPDMNKIQHGECWWRNGNWKDYEATRVTGIVTNMPATTRNPECKHDWCSHTITNCEECLKYSEQWRKDWTEGKNPLSAAYVAPSEPITKQEK